MIFERQDFDPLRDYFSSDDDEVEEVKRSPFDREAVLKYTSQVRNSFNSRTYELVEVARAVDTHPCYSLMFLTLAANKVGEAEAEAAVLTIQEIVFDPIHGPQELHQWRFKPDAPAPADEV